MYDRHTTLILLAIDFYNLSNKAYEEKEYEKFNFYLEKYNECIEEIEKLEKELENGIN